jgi:hypothetical protein
MYTGILNQYQDLYGFADDYPFVSLHEGNTPLSPALQLANGLGVKVSRSIA